MLLMYVRNFISFLCNITIWNKSGCFWPKWILGTLRLLSEGLSSAELHFGRTSEEVSCSSNISGSNDVEKHIHAGWLKEGALLKDVNVWVWVCWGVGVVQHCLRLYLPIVCDSNPTWLKYWGYISNIVIIFLIKYNQTGSFTEES